MTAGRAVWKGALRVGSVTCAVALHTAASTADRIAFRTLNRKTGNPINREFVDEQTGNPVPAGDQVKGYDKGGGDYIILTADEIAEAIPNSDKVLSVETFLPCVDIDTVFLDKPYYLVPDGPAASEAWVLLLNGMRKAKSAALARTVIFRRMRSLLVQPHGTIMMATTLNFDYEVRSAADAFSDIPDMKIKGELLDLAKHIIKTKAGVFHPEGFEDRYEAALATVVKAKMEGRKIAAPAPRKEAKVESLLDALRKSAGKKAPTSAASHAPRKKAS